MAPWPGRYASSTPVRERFSWRLYAYCLMDNHYHLMVETPKANLSLSMRQLGSTRSASTAATDGLAMSSSVVDKQAYLLELSRYVVLNPLRARMVKDPARYPWSSYRASAGLEDL
ncbi:MAG TPA: hypothetical protein VGQ19_14750, partial [Burkholderiales bacterium]|nr:hypothetical protein [Burkholderiales bacterium]